MCCYAMGTTQPCFGWQDLDNITEHIWNKNTVIWKNISQIIWWYIYEWVLQKHNHHASPHLNLLCKLQYLISAITPVTFRQLEVSFHREIYVYWIFADISQEFTQMWMKYSIPCFAGQLFFDYLKYAIRSTRSVIPSADSYINLHHNWINVNDSRLEQSERQFRTRLSQIFLLIQNRCILIEIPLGSARRLNVSSDNGCWSSKWQDISR